MKIALFKKTENGEEYISRFDTLEEESDICTIAAQPTTKLRRLCHAYLENNKE